MEAPAWLWIACTVAAAGAQTARNAMQRSLIERLGTVGATHVRFLFGLPFGIVFLAVVLFAHGASPPAFSATYLGWVLLGAVFQILGTGLMLAAMRERSFVITTAYVKTEPVQVALFGLVFLGEMPSAVAAVAILIATIGVVLMSLPALDAPGPRLAARPMLLGLAAGSMFALSAVGYRGAVLALGHGPFAVRASTALATALTIQTVLLTGYLLVRDRRALAEIMRAWRASVGAGLMGAVASQLWFLAFTLQAAAAVRTLGLVEILFAQALSRRLFAQPTRPLEAVGIGLVVLGVLMLLSA
ncbi:MAG: EamA family transporter [Burkholderiales bacterium]|nr:MAG: EamA family transporter [Burkholderiales bacterium]